MNKKFPENFIKKPKIAFYLGNAAIPNADLRFPDKGNPGIGGSEFGIVMLPYYLSLYYSDFDITIYANIVKYLPDNINSKQVRDSVDAARNAIQDNCQILIIRLCDRDVNGEFIHSINESNLLIITWAQNNPSHQQMHYIATCSNIIRNVCVSHEELDLLRDYPAFYKTTYIYNAIDTHIYKPINHIVGEGMVITYMGSLVKEKGFHILAKAWPIIKEKVPNAKLKVIGSGNLYNEFTPLGDWGIAEENYEKMFRPYLSDEFGNPDPSVEFLGNLGQEKISILQQSDIGIVNPNLYLKDGTETFCWSAVEFQASGTPVVGAAADGLLETIVHKETGLLFHKEKKLAKCIIFLLKNYNLREEYGKNAMSFVQSRFDVESICPQWRDLFYCILNNIPNSITPVKMNFFYHHKIQREIMRCSKYYLPFLQIIPSISEIKDMSKITLFSQLILYLRFKIREIK